MSRSAAIAAALAATAFLLTPSAHAQGASFQGLGDLPGGSFDSRAHAVSADGRVVVGEGRPADGQEAFRWTEGGAMVGLGDLPGATLESQAFGVSPDGAVAVGRGVGGDNRLQAVRWAGGGIQGLGFLPGGISSAARAVSATGVVVGSSGSSGGTRAFRFLGDSLRSLGTLPGGNDSQAFGVSDDGAVIVGYSTGASSLEAFRWTQAGGMVGLGDLPGGAFSSQAFAVSADGSVVVGHGNGASGQEAFRWTAGGGMVGLGDLPGSVVSSTAFAASADGAVVVGQGLGAGGPDAFVWTAAEGMRSLRDVLVAQGVDMSGWTLRVARGVSADGRVIVGEGTNPTGQNEAWRAVISGGHRWIDPTGGSWDVASNWNPPSVPGPNDDVRFDLDATYEVFGGVALGGRTARRLAADNGTVDYNLDNLTLTATTLLNPSLSVSFGATAKIISGTSSVVDAIVGYGSDASAVSRLQVFNSGTTLNVGNYLVVGLEGRGEVFVAAGTLNTFSTSLGGDVSLAGTPAGSGEIIVGNGGNLNTEFLFVGNDAPGTLRVEAGGAVTCPKARLGGGLFAGTVDVSGVSATAERSRFLATDTLDIGNAGPGTLLVRDGASVTAGVLAVGTGDSAMATIGGTVIQGFDAEVVASSIVVGSDGSEVASLEVVSGGSVETNRLFVGGSESTGFARVIGQATLVARADEFAGECQVAIGGNANGTLAVIEGGQVECDKANIGTLGQGTVFVGNNAGAPAPSRLVVSRVLKIGEGDVGTLQLGAGEVDAVDASSSPPADPFDVVIFQEGRVMGTGFLFGSVDNGGVIEAGVTCVPSCPRVPGPPSEEAEMLLVGAAGGSLQIGGRVVMEAGSTLAIPLAGADTTQQGRLRVVAAHGMDGSAALGGSLRLDFQNGYAPNTGDTFLLLDAASTSGAFSATEVTGLEPGWQFEITVVNGTVVLTSLSDGIPTTPAEPGAPTPAGVVLHAPAPNPTAGSTTLNYELPAAGRVRLVLYDMLGREVAVLVDGERPAGAHQAVLQAGRLAPGVYVVRLATAGGAAGRRLTLTR